ncbi:MAG: VWA domain-containing protein, partial [Planctomycetota bacterium]
MRHYHIVASFLFAFASLIVMGQVQATEPARLMTFQQDGQTYYALSLLPSVDQKQADASAVVVLFDTSASQQGAYREKALSSLQALLSNLRPNDRVELLAVDLGVKPLTQSPVAPGSDDLTASVNELSKQIPLGSTDLAGALAAATERLQKFDGGQRSIVYIGDGISVANLVDTTELTQVVGKLRDARVSVSSYAIGPKLDAQLLAVLANQTGGNLYVQAPMVWQQADQGISDARAQAENARKAEIAGRTLAKWTSATVMWPQQVDFASELGKTYPAMLPPLRSDRDTVIIGVTGDVLPNSVSAAIQTDGAAG